VIYISSAGKNARYAECLRLCENPIGQKSVRHNEQLGYLFSSYLSTHWKKVAKCSAGAGQFQVDRRVDLLWKCTKPRR
jgi:hypothetical protein